MINAMLWLLLTLCCCDALVGAQLVETKYGNVSGNVHSLHTGQKVLAFLGVPFAAPPVGHLRFQPPQEPAAWTETFKADRLGNSCPQKTDGLLRVLNPLYDKYDEDCLVMNIYTPKNITNGPYAVMVYMYGGSYTLGSNFLYPGHFLAAKDVIVVVPNYRVGAIGFLTTEDDVVPGNMGLLDQQMALRFVQDNIAAFGGDPNKVTIFGESAGAGSVSLHSLAPSSKGLFHQVFAMSGSDLGFWAVTEPEQKPRNYAQQLARAFNCPTTSSVAMVDCLRTIPWEDIVEVQVDCTAGYYCLGYTPVVDGPGGFLPDTPRELRKRGEFQSLPLMMGLMEKELSIAIFGLEDGDIFDNLTYPLFLSSIEDVIGDIFNGAKPELKQSLIEAFKFFYTPWTAKDDPDVLVAQLTALGTDLAFGAPMDEQLRSNVAVAPTYAFVQEYISAELKNILPEWLGAFHAADIPYMFGWPFLSENLLVQLETGMIIDIFIEFTEDDKKYSDFFATLFANFAKYGNPTPEPIKSPFDDTMVVWNEYTEDARNSLYLANKTTNVLNYRQQEYAFWNEYISNMMDRYKDVPPTTTTTQIPRTSPPMNSARRLDHQHWLPLLLAMVTLHFLTTSIVRKGHF